MKLISVKQILNLVINQIYSFLQLFPCILLLVYRLQNSAVPKTFYRSEDFSPDVSSNQPASPA